jgi:hypothetical protein
VTFKIIFRRSFSFLSRWQKLWIIWATISAAQAAAAPGDFYSPGIREILTKKLISNSMSICVMLMHQLVLFSISFLNNVTLHYYPFWQERKTFENVNSILNESKLEKKNTYTR